MQRDPCKELWCIRLSYVSLNNRFCQTKSEPALEGTQCGQNKVITKERVICSLTSAPRINFATNPTITITSILHIIIIDIIFIIVNAVIGQCALLYFTTPQSSCHVLFFICFFFSTSVVSTWKVCPHEWWQSHNSSSSTNGKTYSWWLEFLDGIECMFTVLWRRSPL